MTTTIAFNKPYGVLSRFTPDGSPHAPLSMITPPFPKDVYPVGRLDADSEGLLVLSSDKALVDRLLHPRFQHRKVYWVEVERIPDPSALAQLEAGVLLDGERTRPARASLMAPPTLWERQPPVRFRKNVPTQWLSLEISEGKNRQVRRMTAAVGHPTLRLVRHSIGGLALGELATGTWRVLFADDILRLLNPQHSGLVRR